MRRILAAAATLGLAGLGALVPASGSQAASEACDNAWHNAPSGHFRAYNSSNCSGLLGSDPGYDGNWSNSEGRFQGTDNDKATSLVHKGTSGMAVKVYQHSHYSGGHTCLAKAEYYMDTLSGHYYTNGVSVNNSISSHEWAWHSNCAKFLDS
ncbi:hypothetical protein [Streptomyces synnematoformans]|uniref:Secreted protein n=1 Tax=Streptomyces synnematoformans TaxID=415721 RepID=A0ABN2XNS8_9ACTN